MFDRLIESGTTGAEFKSRSRYFLISSVVVGLLFVSAVIFSIYAAEVGLGNDSFELSMIVAPPEPPQIEPEPPRQERQISEIERTSQVPMRAVRQLAIEASPSEVPPIAVTPNKYLSLPPGPVEIGSHDTLGPPNMGPVKEGPGTGAAAPVTPANDSSEDESRARTAPPPRIEKPGPPRSIGVVNGIATNLPKPPYPPVAIATGIQGKVDVQVTIDEHGNVISAKAASGNVLLRDAAVRAALKARFTPTKLSDVPIKVTGVIVYNFTRN